MAVVHRRRRARRCIDSAVDAACVLLVLASLVHEMAAQSASDDESDNGDDTLPSDASTATLLGGAEFVANALNETGDAVLIRRFPKFWSGNAVCKNAPFVLSKDGPANGQCPDALTGLGLSCTCLTNFKKSVKLWELNVSKKRVTTGTPVKALASTASLNVTKIAPFAFVSVVEEVRLIGSGPNSESIEFLGDVSTQGVKSTPKFESLTESKATVLRIYIENINLTAAVRNKDFFETSVTDLTLKNCGLVDGSDGFLRPLSSLSTLNLESNGFTKIPSEVLLLSSVKHILLSNNPITNVTITDEQFQFINATQIFGMDPAATATGQCVGGVFKSTKGFTFCVSNGTPSVDSSDASRAGATGTTPSTSSGSTKYLLVGVISGCVIVAVLVFLIVRRRSSQAKEDSAFVKQPTHSILEDTISFDNSKESHQFVDSSLLNDPIIITHRIPHNDVKVATCISRGGFGLVYSGTFSRRRVAIKKIRPELSADIKYIESFLKEICLMASLSHPRIVEFIGLSWDSLRNLSAVTEFMERGDLRDVLHSTKTQDARLTWDGHKVRIAMHIAEALTYLHSLSPKVIHRDLKSKNVLLDTDMTAKLSDFGVSRERRFEETHMTAGIGTAFWIAPEVLLGMDYDEHADIFSYGVVLSEIDTDDYPYWNEKNPSSGGKQQENVILRMVATGALRPEFTPSCPGPILELAYACLEVDPEKRPTAAEIAYRLQQLIRSSPLTPEPVFTTE